MHAYTPGSKATAVTNASDPITRPRLTERLARAARFPVALIVAPAGFGKSVALRDYLARKNGAAMLYAVDRGDTTLAAFVRGLIEALAPVAPSARATLAGFQQQLMAGSDPVATTVDWLGAHLAAAAGTIVVDDLHVAAADPDVVAVLVEIIERTHDRMRWIVSMRPEVELPVAAWVGYGRMDVPVGEDELRFTADEARAAAADSPALAVPDEIEALRELTAGWPLAFTIALRARMHAADLRAAAHGTRELLHGYLAEHVFAAATPEQRELLLASCVFSAFDLALVDALGFPAAALGTLRRRIAFIEELAPETFRYHELFRGYLERELRNRGDDTWRGAHRRGAALMAARGDDAAALVLATKAADHAGMLLALERRGLDLIERGQAELIVRALEQLPENIRADHPAVLGVRAVIEANRGHLDVAERCFNEAIARAADAETRLALIHRYAIEQVRSDRDCAALLQPLVADATLPKRWRVLLEGTLATAHARAGRLLEAQTVIALAIEHVEALPDGLRARIYQQAAYVYQFGSRDRARRYATLAVELAEASGLFEIAARAYSILYTFVSDEDDDPIASLVVLEKLADAARKGASLQVRIFGLIAAYEIEAERGNAEALDRLDAELGTVPDQFARTRIESLLPAQALRAAWSGDLRAAYAILAGSHEHQGSDERRALRAAEIAVYAFAAAEPDEGARMLTLATAILEETGGPPRRRVRTRLMMALAELIHGHTAAAHRSLSLAEAQLAPTMGRLRTLAFAVRAAYRIAMQQAEPAAFSAALTRLHEAHLGGLARLLDALPLAAHVDGGYATLTQSERAILAQLAEGASTKDIAGRSARSPQTVDTHIRSICRKLHCSGRREAIAFARRAGWLDN